MVSAAKNFKMGQEPQAMDAIKGGSRVGKSPIAIPQGVQVSIEGSVITVKGRSGELQRTIHNLVNASVVDNKIIFRFDINNERANALGGTTRALVNNMVTGVTEGFSRSLKLVGVGFRALVQGNVLNLTVGFSHPVNFEIPVGIKIEAPTATDIIIKGSDKQLVTQIAANIRAVRPPEPYKGKGIRYTNEVIQLKEGKKK